MVEQNACDPRAAECQAKDNAAGHPKHLRQQNSIPCEHFSLQSSWNMKLLLISAQLKWFNNSPSLAGHTKCQPAK